MNVFQLFSKKVANTDPRMEVALIQNGLRRFGHRQTVAVTTTIGMSETSCLPPEYATVEPKQRDPSTGISAFHEDPDVRRHLVPAEVREIMHSKRSGEFGALKKQKRSSLGKKLDRLLLD